MNEESMKELLRILDVLLKQHFERATERLNKRKDEDYDEVRIFNSYLLIEQFIIIIRKNIYFYFFFLVIGENIAIVIKFSTSSFA